ncbi:MAG: hypothetical protein IKD10_10785 [Lentisphaeria bacterium]|nr:hypothetical protein [Lentisphaeria bacterium]
MKILLVLARFDRHKWDALTDQAWSIARLLTAAGGVQCVIAAARAGMKRHWKWSKMCPSAALLRICPAGGSCGKNRRSVVPSIMAVCRDYSFFCRKTVLT